MLRRINVDTNVKHTEFIIILSQPTVTQTSLRCSYLQLLTYYDYDNHNDNNNGGVDEDDAAASLISCFPERWFFCYPIHLYSKSAGSIVSQFICTNICWFYCHVIYLYRQSIFGIALCIYIVNLMILLLPCLCV